MKKKLIPILILFFISITNIYAINIYVNTEAELLAAINNSKIDTINIGNHIIYLTNASPSDGILITRKLTINGPFSTSKFTINAEGKRRIFNIEGGNLTINNLILTETASSGAVRIYAGYFTAINCSFTNKYANSQGVYSEYRGVFTAINCNFTNYLGIAVNAGTFIGINCTFYKNNVSIWKTKCYLYHCTFYDNGMGFNNNIYSYNCVFTEKELSWEGNFLDGNNLITNGTVSQAAIFGTNTLTMDGYITPLPFATSAIKLTANSIKIPIGVGVSEESIISWLSKDQAGKPRPYSSNKFVTFGSIEVERKTEPETYKVNLNSNIPEAVLTGAGDYAENTRVTINANLTDGCYLSNKWIDENDNVVSSSNTLSITLVRDTILTADIKLKQYNLWVDAATEGGTTNPYGNIAADCGRILTLTAIPDNCYKFKGWALDYNGHGNNYNYFSYSNPLDIIMPLQTPYHYWLSAVFEYDTCFSLTLNTTTGGSTNPSGTSTRSRNETATLTATPDSCYTFKNWTDKNNNVISTANTLNIVIISDTTLTANFELLQYDLVVKANEGGTATGAGKYDCSSSQTITAISDSNYIFVNWTDKNNNVVSTNNPLEVILISDTIIIANFGLSISEDDIFDISIVPNPTDSDFNIIFENTDEQKIKVELLDIEGKKLLDIFDGMASAGTQTYPITTKLPSGTYLVKFVIAGKQVVRKVVVR